MTIDTVRLPDAPWRHQPGLDALLMALDAARGAARYVGGAVRDGLLGVAVKDVDIATTLLPRTVLERLHQAGIKAVPTGIEHGTVTAVLQGWPVEITTLRRDVSTDGRRATIAFTNDWQEDAARRDFTINALFADPLTGVVTDYFDGLSDLSARRVRFIGRAEARIAEDHLRILRYFRFLARFGSAEPDAEAYAACRAHANSLKALSRERVADELLKLLAVANPLPAVRLMVAGGVLIPILPEITPPGVCRMEQLVAAEATSGLPLSAVRRLVALLPPDPDLCAAVAARLKLSNRARKRMALAAGAAADPAEIAYRFGAEAAIDRLLLAGDACEAARIARWTPPVLPITGGALIARGLPAGPDVAKALRAIEDQWIAEGFPDEVRLSTIADQTVSKFQRARQ